MTADASKPAQPAWDHPPFLWMSGRLVPWEDCLVHVTSGYAQRGASVFEGIRIYRAGSSGSYLALALEEHLKRLALSWHTLSLPNSFSDNDLKKGISDLLAQRSSDDSYCRVTKYLGQRTIDNPREPDHTIVALYNSPQLLGKPVKCITSSWRRNEFGMPAQMKIGGHYFLLSWVRQQAQQLGADDAILLNDRDFVSEATGTAVFAAVDKKLVTPPTSDGALPSITAQIVVKLANQLNIPVSIRSLHRSDLLRADGVFLAGTLDELRPVSIIDRVTLPDALQVQAIKKIFDAFARVCRSGGTEWGTPFKT